MFSFRLAEAAGDASKATALVSQLGVPQDAAVSRKSPPGLLSKHPLAPHIYPAAFQQHALVCVWGTAQISGSQPFSTRGKKILAPSFHSKRPVDATARQR